MKTNWQRHLLRQRVQCLPALLLYVFILRAPLSVHAQHIPEPKAQLAGVFCPVCMHCTPCPGGKKPNACGKCGHSFAQQSRPHNTPTRPLPPLGHPDGLYHRPPPKPTDNRLYYNDDPNNSVKPPTNDPKELAETIAKIKEQDRKKKEEAEQEFERKKRDALKNGGKLPADSSDGDTTSGVRLNNPFNKPDAEGSDYLRSLQTGAGSNITFEERQRQKLSGYKGSPDGYPTGSAPYVPSAWGTPDQVYEMMTGRKPPIVEDSMDYTKNALKFLAKESVGVMREAAEDFVVTRLGPTGQVLCNIPKATEEILLPALHSAAKGELSLQEADRLPLKMAIGIFNDGSASTELANKIIEKGSLTQGTISYVKEKATEAVGDIRQAAVDSAVGQAVKSFKLEDVYEKTYPWFSVSTDKGPAAWTATFQPKVNE